MSSEHDGYAFTKALRRAKAKAVAINVAVGGAMVVVPCLGGYWLGDFRGAVLGSVLGAGVGLITGFIPFQTE